MSARPGLQPEDSYAVWCWNSANFWASTQEISGVYPPNTGDLEHFDVGGVVSVAAGGVSNPWYTIGS